MKNTISIISAFVISIANTVACTVCKVQQPKILKGITHGAGPDSNWDYLIVAIMVAVVVGTFLMSARYLIKPGEANDDHVKYSILK